MTKDRGPSEDIRDDWMKRCQDVAMLHAKWSTYLELFSGPENAALLSGAAPAFFQIVEESLRNDLILSICRLSDPSRTLGGDKVSLASLVADCGDVPRVHDLLTAFQAACGPVRRYRHRHLGHNDLGAIIRPRADLLPDVGRDAVDEILRLAGGILRAVSRHFGGGDLDFRPVPAGGAGDLIARLRAARGPEAGTIRASVPADRPAP
jgi:hypothetical protein